MLEQLSISRHQAFARLSRYRSDFISSAPDRIARKMGAKDLADLDRRHKLTRFVYLSPDSSPQIRNLCKEEILLTDPDNLTVAPRDYLNFEVALEYLPGPSGRKVLQLACNYGPYLYYLRDRAGLEVAGVDLNPAAAAYANEHGLGVTLAPANALPFPSGHFDLVMSRNFLRFDYICSWLRQSADLFPEVLAEVRRVLKPGGIFLSDLEHFDAELAGRSFQPLRQFPLDWMPELSVWQRAES